MPTKKLAHDRATLTVVLSREQMAQFDRVADRLCAEAGVIHTRSSAVRIAVKRLASMYNVLEAPKRKRASAASTAQ
jgi:hypothetical protein